MSPVKIYDPTTAVKNPNYNPSLPTGPSNFPYTRSQFTGNQIPFGSINPLLEAFLFKYVPQPNMMMTPGAADSNTYYLDVRTESHFQDQGTFRVDHNFSNGDTLLGRYSAGSENGFSPSSGMTSTTENLPGFGVNFNNLSQQSVILLESRFLRHQTQHFFRRFLPPLYGSHPRRMTPSTTSSATRHPGHRLWRQGRLGRAVVCRSGIYRHR